MVRATSPEVVHAPAAGAATEYVAFAIAVLPPLLSETETDKLAPATVELDGIK